MNYKKILIPIIILVICIILVTLALLFITNKKKMDQENPLTLPFEDIEEITNKTLFLQIEQHIKTYIDYIIRNNIVAVNEISKNKSLEIDANKLYTVYRADEMYAINKIDNLTVFVKELARGTQIQDEYYLIMNIDYKNNTYQIIVSDKQEFENAKNNIVDEKYKENIYIKKNDYNEYVNGTFTDFQVLKKYFDDYKFNAINNPELAFSMIDASYRKAKFNNDLEQYKAYVQKNINSLQDANILKHGVTRENGYFKYSFVDNFDNYYELTETGIYEYAIILDNYTLQTSEQKAEYNRLTDEEKALSNIDKVMKLIDEKDYNTVYRYLNTDFKNTNFPTIEAFTKYMQENFFENNKVGQISIKSEGNVFILSVPYKESLSSAAERRTKTFIIKLGEGTDFEISFEI